MKFLGMSFPQLLFILVLFGCAVEVAGKKYLCPRSERAFQRAEVLYAGVEEECDKRCESEKAAWKRYNQTEREYIELYDDYKECYSECETELMSNYSSSAMRIPPVKVKAKGEKKSNKTISWKKDPEIKRLQDSLQKECYDYCKPASDAMNEKKKDRIIRDVFFSCLYVCYSEQQKNPRKCHAIYLEMLLLGFNGRAL